MVYFALTYEDLLAINRGVVFCCNSTFTSKQNLTLKCYPGREQKNLLQYLILIYLIWL